MIKKKISGLILAIALTLGSLSAYGALTTKDWAYVFADYNLLSVYFILLSDAAGSSRSLLDVTCEYFRNQNRLVYLDLMNNPNHVEAARACCHYEPNPSQFPVCSI